MIGTEPGVLNEWLTHVSFFQTLIAPKPTQITLKMIFIIEVILKLGKIVESYAKLTITASFGLGVRLVLVSGTPKDVS